MDNLAIPRYTIKTKDKTIKNLSYEDAKMVIRILINDNVEYEVIRL